MGRYLPAETRLTELPMPTQDVVLQLFSHRSVEVPIGVPAVVEPLLVPCWPVLRRSRSAHRAASGAR